MSSHPEGGGTGALAALRSMLFVPGVRPEIIGKAERSGTDAVIFDLEDAVPEAAKEEARRNLGDLPALSVPLVVRVNGGDSGHLWPDVVATAGAGAAGLILPKAEDPGLLARIDGALTALEVASGRAAGGTALIPLVESALGVHHAYQLFTASPRIRTVLFGSGEQGDLVADLGCEWTPDGAGLATARSQVLLAARAAGVPQPMEAVYMDFRNSDGLRTECLLARRIGYVGKVAIHPQQVGVINEVFTPAPDEVAHHRRIVEEFEKALAAGQAAVAIDGRMVDYAVARVSRAVLARAAGRAGVPGATA